MEMDEDPEYNDLLCIPLEQNMEIHQEGTSKSKSKKLKRETKTPSRGKRRKQLSWDKEDVIATFGCTKCGKRFQSDKGLRLHKKTIHGDDIPGELQYNYRFDSITEMYTCITCDKECNNKDDIEKHVVQHEDIYVCEWCQKIYHQPYDFSIHMHSHAEDDSALFECPLCEYKTKARTCMLTHINRSHLSKFLYSCEFCMKNFNDIVMFREHIEHHKGNLNAFECVVCQKTFPYSRYLSTHQVRNHRVTIDGVLMPNQCPFCNRKFAKEESLIRHLKSHEPRLEPYEKTHLCDICGKGFARKDKLRIHYRVHTGYKPYKCSYCDKAFTKRDYLTMHERIHSGEKPYSCEYCGKCFNQGAPLRIHVRSHTGERPFVCSICKFGFSSRGAMNIHMRTCTVPD